MATNDVMKYVAILQCENRPVDHQVFGATLETVRRWALRTLENHPIDARITIYEVKRIPIEVHIGTISTTASV